MGEKIAISDQKEIKVEFNQEFDDVDLLSDAEKAALEVDIDMDGPGEVEKAEADKAAAEEKAAADKAAADAKAAKAKEAEDKAAADAKAAEDAAKAEADAKAAKDKEAEEAAKAEADAEKAAKAEEPAAKIVADSAPLPTLQGLSEEELKAVKDGLADAKKKFQEGEIDYDEYLDARDGFNQQLWAHNLAMQFSAESVDTRWEWEQETFLTAEENEWINNDDVVYSAFAATVNRIMSTDEGAVMPGPQLLALAREEVAKRFSPEHQVKRVDDEEEKKKQAALKAAKDKEAKKQPPETLGGKPAAEIDDGVGEFEWLDKLEGEAYEKAVSNLSEEQLKRYEAST